MKSHVPRYTVFAHRRVVKFLGELGEEAERIKEAIRKLVDYPLPCENFLGEAEMRTQGSP